MIKSLKNESWKPLKFKKGIKPQNKYAVSNLGRIASFEKTVDDGQILNGSVIGGYKTMSLRTGEISQTLYIHKVVAENFVEKKNPKQKLVIHLDHDKTNNKAKNLSWATFAEAGKNKSKNPAFQERISKKPSYSKLTSAKVKVIKTALAKGVSASSLATKYDMSTVQIYRIKRGEVWAHVVL